MDTAIQEPFFGYVLDPKKITKDECTFWTGFILGKTRELLKDIGPTQTDLIKTLPPNDRKSVIFITEGSTRENHFVMRFGNSFEDHCMDPDRFAVSGEIKPAQGILPVLVMICLKKSLSQHGDGSMANDLQFCDEEGNVFEYHEWDDIKPICEKFTVGLDDAKALARKTGLIGKSLSELLCGANHKQSYF